MQKKKSDLQNIFWGLGTPALGSGSMRSEFRIKNQPRRTVLTSLRGLGFWVQDKLENGPQMALDSVSRGVWHCVAQHFQITAHLPGDRF
jgi:hypothetical protein